MTTSLSNLNKWLNSAFRVFPLPLVSDGLLAGFILSQWPLVHVIKALFRCKIFLDFDMVVLSFVFDKHCLIMD